MFAELKVESVLMVIEEVLVIHVSFVTELARVVIEVVVVVIIVVVVMSMK
jgi:hypothetical protein